MLNIPPTNVPQNIFQDLNLFYELIEFASEIEHGPEDDHLNKSWEKAINDYLKKFYPKEKYYYSFTHENL